MRVSFEMTKHESEVLRLRTELAEKDCGMTGAEAAELRKRNRGLESDMAVLKQQVVRERAGFDVRKDEVEEENRN